MGEPHATLHLEHDWEGRDDPNNDHGEPKRRPEWSYAGTANYGATASTEWRGA